MGKMKKINCSRFIYLIVLVGLLGFGSSVNAHSNQGNISQQVKDWLSSLDAKQQHIVTHAFEDPERFEFTWLPGRRAGIRLDALDEKQKSGLRKIFNFILSDQGVVKVDAIIATEAALAVISNSPEYRNPDHYYTAVFGEPGKHLWSLRFEGHHLSLNFTFQQDELISATPLFVGANPETIPVGPDKGLRALEDEVDLGRKLFKSLSKAQKEQAAASNEWFKGFLTNPGARRAKLGKPAGIVATKLSQEQQALLKSLISIYINNIRHEYSEQYLQAKVDADWSSLYFFWRGEADPGEEYYYRIQGSNILIEHETQSNDTHIHAIWRDVKEDFGDQFNN